MESLIILNKSLIMDFTSAGPRMYNHREWNPYLCRAFSGIFFWGSTAWYVQRYFLKNRSVFKLALFIPSSYFVAQAWSKVLFLPVEQEALIINNSKELGKLKKQNLIPFHYLSVKSQSPIHLHLYF